MQHHPDLTPAIHNHLNRTSHTTRQITPPNIVSYIPLAHRSRIPQ